MFGAEIAAVGVGVALTGWLLWRRRWGEATYIGLQIWAFTTSSWFFSVPRATLLWWPLWIALAAWSLRRPVVSSAVPRAAGPAHGRGRRRVHERALGRLSRAAGMLARYD